MVWSIVRASHHPFRGDVPKGRPPPIPIYHVHGFLPERAGGYMEAPDTLVFTDAQFWECTANPMSFANRVMATALHDSNCIFVGLSMRDVNLMRWLGVRYNEVMEDKHEQHRHLGVPRDPAKAAARALDRHFWIHAENDDADGLVARMLVRRGVRSVRIPSWDSPDCGEIIRRCFG